MRWQLMLLGGGLALLQGCSTSSFQAPVQDLGATPQRKVEIIQAREHVVAKGETLFSIAYRYGLDYRQLAQVNGIKAPSYTIYAGQRLQLHQGGANAPASRTASRATTTASTNSKAASSRQEAANTSSSRKTAAKSSTPVATGSVQWQWPASGKVLNTFSPNRNSDKGINIAGKQGDPVKAAADGVVVYAGNGLRGYVNLVIINHNQEFLSAYAHNHRILVKEQQQVKAGQQIAEMGQAEAGQGKLYFEIRRDGQPVNPLQYLPRR